ncbi:amidohydrolase 3 [Mycena floridula]|nr:amidohydrolase 3 [Mycena floridula]
MLFHLWPAIISYVWLHLKRDYTVCSASNSIYTVEEDSSVQCILIRGQRIQDIGSLVEIQARRRSWWPESVLHISPTSIIVPGLADAHAHVVENGFKMQLPLESARSISDVVELVKAYILDHPDLERNRTRWVQGMAWDQTKWPGGQFPTAADLAQDPVLKDRPIALRRIDGHALWVSPRVLELTGDLPAEVEGGLIVRDSDVKPTGIFLDNAIQLIPQPPWSEDEVAEFADATMKMALAYGLTSIHDAAAEPYMIAHFKKQAELGKLPLRLYLMGFSFSDTYWGSQIPRLVNYGKQGRLNVRAIKLFADGALGSFGSALLEPYSDSPETSGFLLSDPAVLLKYAKQFREDGFQVNIHCIGDRANKEILDIFETILREDSNVTEWRPRIEHAQIMTQADLHRIGQLGVIPSVQPTHATSDMGYAESRLGPERIKGAYAYKTLLESSQNKVLPLGSDFPVEGVNPLLGFYAAVTRLAVDGTSPHGEGGWYAEEKLARAQALKGMTLDAAYASFAEKELGSLKKGKKADFVVLDRDIMKVPVKDILGTKVIATVIDGKVVYGQL